MIKFCAENAAWFPLSIDLSFILYIIWCLCKYFPYCLKGLNIWEFVFYILPHTFFFYKKLWKCNKLIYEFFYTLIFRWKYVIYAYYWSKGLEWIILDFLLILFFIYPVLWIVKLLLIIYRNFLSWLFLILDILILDIICNVWIFIVFRKLYRIFRKTVFFLFYDYWRYIVYYRILKKWEFFLWKCRYRYTSERFFKWVHRMFIIRFLDWFELRIVKPLFRLVQFRSYFIGRWLYNFILHPYFVIEEYVLRLWRFIRRFPRLCFWYIIRFIKRIPARIRFLWKMRNLDYRKGFYRRSFINFLVSLKLYFSGKKALLVKRFKTWERVNSSLKIPSPWYKFYISVYEDLLWLKIWWGEFKYFVQEMIGPYKDFIIQKFFSEAVIDYSDTVGVKKVKVEVEDDNLEERLEAFENAGEHVKDFMRKNSKVYEYEYELDLEEIELFVNDNEIERRWDKSFELRYEWYKKLFYFFKDKIINWFISSYFYISIKIYYFKFVNWFHNSNLKIILIWFFDRNILTKIFRVIIDLFIDLFHLIVNLYIRFLIILFTFDKNFVLTKSIFFIIIKRFFIISKLNFKLSILHKINFCKLLYIYILNWVYYYRMPKEYIILFLNLIYIILKDLLMLLYLYLKQFFFELLINIADYWGLGWYLMYYLIEIQFTFKLFLSKYENFYKKYFITNIIKEWKSFDPLILKFDKKKFDGKKTLSSALSERRNKNNRRIWNDKWNKYLNYIFRFFRILIPFCIIYYLWASCIGFIIYIYKSYSMYTDLNDIIIIFDINCITFENNGVDNILFGVNNIILNNYGLSLDDYLAFVHSIKDCYINFCDIINHYRLAYAEHKFRFVTPFEDRFWDMLATYKMHGKWLGKEFEIVSVPPWEAYMVVLREMSSTISPGATLPKSYLIRVGGFPMYLILLNDLYFNIWHDLHFTYAYWGSSVLNGLFEWNLSLLADIVKMDNRWHSHVIYPELNGILCILLDSIVHIFLNTLKILLFLMKTFIIMSRFITIFVPQIILLVFTIIIRLLLTFYIFLFSLIHCPDLLKQGAFYVLLGSHFVESVYVVKFIFQAIIIPAFYINIIKQFIVLLYFIKFMFCICYATILSYLTCFISTVAVDEQFHPILNTHCLINVYWGNFPWDTVIFVKSFYATNKFVFYVYPLMDFNNWYESFRGYLDILELSLGPKIIFSIKSLNIKYFIFVGNSYIIFPFEQFDLWIITFFVNTTNIAGFMFSYKEVCYYTLAFISYILFRIIRFFVRLWYKGSSIIAGERIIYYRKKKKREAVSKGENNIKVNNDVSSLSKKDRNK